MPSRHGSGFSPIDLPNATSGETGDASTLLSNGTCAPPPPSWSGLVAAGCNAAQTATPNKLGTYMLMNGGNPPGKGSLGHACKLWCVTWLAITKFSAHAGSENGGAGRRGFECQVRLGNKRTTQVSLPAVKVEVKRHPGTPTELRACCYATGPQSRSARPGPAQRQRRHRRQTGQLSRYSQTAKGRQRGNLVQRAGGDDARGWTSQR